MGRKKQPKHVAAASAGRAHTPGSVPKQPEKQPEKQLEQQPEQQPDRRAQAPQGTATAAVAAAAASPAGIGAKGSAVALPGARPVSPAPDLVADYATACILSPGAPPTKRLNPASAPFSLLVPLRHRSLRTNGARTSS